MKIQLFLKKGEFSVRHSRMSVGNADSSKLAGNRFSPGFFWMLIVAGLLLGCKVEAQDDYFSIVNGSFEAPVVGPTNQSSSYKVNPSGATWTFSGAAGIAANGSIYGSQVPPTPDGAQFAFLDSVGGSGATMSQSFDNPLFEYFTPLYFYAVQRDQAGGKNTQDQTLTIEMDGVPVGSVTPGTNWTYYEIDFPLEQGTHTLTFSAASVPGDATVLVDDMFFNNIYAVQPPNDDFANSQVISGLTNTILGDTTEATSETGEPEIGGYPANKSVWYSWTAPTNGIVNLVFSSDDAGLSVYYGSALTNLFELTNSEYAFNYYSQTYNLSFPALMGTTYHIAVNTPDLYEAFFSLNFQCVPPLPPPPNDAINNAIYVGFIDETSQGDEYKVTKGYNRNATSEASDPYVPETAGKTVWYQLVDLYGYFTIDTRNSDFDTELAVYYLNDQSLLVPVVSDHGSAGNGASTVTFFDTAEQNYYICVDGYLNGPNHKTSGNIVLNFTNTVPPPNDDFSNATPIVLDVNQSVTNYDGNNVLATMEDGEPSTDYAPNFFDIDHSVWWRWTAPQDCVARVSDAGSSSGIPADFSGFVAVYTGSSVNDLTRVAWDTGLPTIESYTSVTAFNAQAGTTYYIQVAGVYDPSHQTVLNDVGNVVLTLTTYIPNDNFTNGRPIVGTAATFQGSNVGATGESNEPPLPPALTVFGEPTNSAWYTWTAPSAGGTVIDIQANYSSPLIAVYTNNSLATLSNVTVNSSTFSEARAAFTAISNVTYQISIQGTEFGSSSEGPFTGTLTETPPPANDLFANRTVIPGLYYAATGSFLGASREVGEPAGNPLYPQTLWWSWTAPANVGATNIPVRLAANSPNWMPSIGVYTGSVVSALSQVPTVVQSNAFKAVNNPFSASAMTVFNANPGTTYQICLSGYGGDPGGNVISPRFGNFEFRLNATGLTLTPTNFTATQNGGGGWNYSGTVVVADGGPAGSHPLQLRTFSASGVSVLGQDNGYATSNDVSGSTNDIGTLAPGQQAFVNVTGSIPAVVVTQFLFNQSQGDGYGAYVELDEAPITNDWFAVDQALIGYADWPNLNGNTGPGGGVVRLDPDFIGSSSFNILTNVSIQGVSNVIEGGSAPYFGRAAYYDGTVDVFSNTVWTASLFTITNGYFSAGSVASNTPVTLGAQYSYDTFLYTAAVKIVVGHVPPPVFGGVRRIANGGLVFTLQDVPGRTNIILTATNQSAPIVWVPVFTNHAGTNGSFNYTNFITPGPIRRFFRTQTM